MKTYLNSKSLCEYFDISIATLNRWVASGKLPKPSIVNKHRFWKLEDIEEAASKLMEAGA